jgi:hypothetical protein
VGTEVHGTVSVGGQKVNVKGDFASDHVTFSGGRRGEVPYTKIVVVSTAKGVLKLRVDDAVMEFPLGQKVDRLANKIRSPPTLMDKLGVKPGMKTVGLDVPSFLAKQIQKTAAYSEHEPSQPVPMLFLAIKDTEGLERLAGLVRRIQPEGALWVVYPKGKRDIRESDVLAAGREAGLKDVKVARISPTHTALKFVVPLADRPADD